MTEATPRRTSVLVIHPEPILSAGLVAALQAPDLDVRRDDAPTSAWISPPPTVVVCDYRTALGLLPCSASMARSRLDTKIMIVVSEVREYELRHALQMGAQGFLMLGAGIDELLAGVRTLARGGRYMSLAVAQRMADCMTRESLTAREEEVLRLLARGECNKRIAKSLDIALGTVKAHVRGIMSKLHAESRTQAVSVASRLGLVTDLEVALDME